MRTLKRLFLTSIVLSVAMANAQTPAPAPAAQDPAAPAKKYKDNAEYELYNDITKAFAANDYTKAITGLDSWVQKYPDSDYKNDRALLPPLQQRRASVPHP